MTRIREEEEVGTVTLTTPRHVAVYISFTHLYFIIIIIIIIIITEKYFVHLVYLGKLSRPKYYTN